MGGLFLESNFTLPADRLPTGNPGCSGCWSWERRNGLRFFVSSFSLLSFQCPPPLVARIPLSPSSLFFSVLGSQFLPPRRTTPLLNQQRSEATAGFVHLGTCGVDRRLCGIGRSACWRERMLLPVPCCEQLEHWQPTLFSFTQRGDEVLLRLERWSK